MEPARQRHKKKKTRWFWAAAKKGGQLFTTASALIRYRRELVMAACLLGATGLSVVHQGPLVC